MKEENSNLKNVVGMIAFISFNVIIIGIFIMVCAAEMAILPKVIICAIIVLFYCVTIVGVAVAKERNLKMEEMEHRLDNLTQKRKPFQERVDELKKQKKP